MKKKITNNQIIASIIEKSNFKEQDIKLFLQKLSQVLLDEILSKKSVEIEDLGEFLLDTSKYKNNISYKIKFNPERSIKDKVNEELSFLHKVELSEELAMSSLPLSNLSKQADEIKDILSEIQETEEEEDNSPAQKDKPLIINTTTKADDTKSKEIETGNSDSLESDIEKKETIVETNNNDEKQVDTATTDDTKFEDTQSASYSKTTEIYPALKDDITEIELYRSKKKNRRKKIILLSSISVIILFGVFYFFMKTNKILPTDKQNFAQINKFVYSEKLNKRDPIYLLETRQYKNFSDTITANSGTTLVQIAQKYLGDKLFWVYIYEANKENIPNANNIIIGSKIKIPKMNSILTNKTDSILMLKLKEVENNYKNLTNRGQSNKKI